MLLRRFSWKCTWLMGRLLSLAAMAAFLYLCLSFFPDVLDSFGLPRLAWPGWPVSVVDTALQEVGIPAGVAFLVIRVIAAFLSTVPFQYGAKISANARNELIRVAR